MPEKETFKRSESIKELSIAMADFQSKVATVKKDANNPFFKSKYAPLESIIEAIKEPLAKAGLSYVQMPTGTNLLVTILMHKSGEFIESTVTLHPKSNTPQDHGSALTYMRRYALSAMLGIATEEDDDGNAASGKNVNANAPVKPAAPVKPTQTPEQKLNSIKSAIVNIMEKQFYVMRNDPELVTKILATSNFKGEFKPENFEEILQNLEFEINERNKAKALNSSGVKGGTGAQTEKVAETTTTA